jgi:hypothetical protein
MEKTVFEHRRDNLLQLIERYETQEALQRVTGIAASVLSRMKSWTPTGTNPNHKRIGEKLARQFEETLKLPAYWMDAPHTTEELKGVKVGSSRLSALSSLAVPAPVSRGVAADTATLSPIQVATHDTLVKLMAAGKLPDTACLKLLQAWQGALEELDQSAQGALG